MLTQAKADEAEQLEQLIEAAFIPYCQGLGREWAGPYPWLEEAIAAGRILWIDQPKGCAVIDRDGDTLKIEQIAIDPAHQGQGIGGRAMAALEQLARKTGFSGIHLHTAQIFPELVGFYSRQGYRVVDIRPTESGKDDIPRIHMFKPLS